jgi:hypothetical protein
MNKKQKLELTWIGEGEAPRRRSHLTWLRGAPNDAPWMARLGAAPGMGGS